MATIQWWKLTNITHAIDRFIAKCLSGMSEGSRGQLRKMYKLLEMPDLDDERQGMQGFASNQVNGETADISD